MEDQAQYIPKSRQDWHDKHQQLIGASEIPSLMGLNPYKSPYQLWLEKTGREEPFAGNEDTRRGLLLEQAVADHFEQDTGHRVIKASAKDVIYIHKEYPYIGGTPDRLYFPKEKDGKRVLECKTTRMLVEEMPLSWYVQLQVYLGLTGGDRGAIAWLSSYFGFNFGNAELDFDAETYSLAIGAAVKFYNEYWQADTPPPATTVADVEQMYRKHLEGKYLEANSELAGWHMKLGELRHRIKELDNEASGYEEKIKLTYTDYEGVTFQGSVLSTWKATKDIQRFDKKRFEQQYPQLYQQFINTEPGQRRFLLKL